MLSEPPFNVLDTFVRIDDAIDVNAELAEHILQNALASLGLEDEPEKGSAQYWMDAATPSDIGKANSTIRQFFRDWSREGQRERDVCYGPVLCDLEKHFGSSAGVKVLIPGAGLGRLVLELCLAGYHAEGNEISYHQLFASNWVLNHSTRPQEFAIHPFALQFSNVKTREQQLRKVMIPDVHPATAVAERLSTTNASTPQEQEQEQEHQVGSMSMTSSDFLLAYSQASHANAFDAVATVFFIDTAPNLIRYIQTLHHCLRQGGVWTNVGPLLWHFDGNADNEGVADEQSAEDTDKANEGDRGIAEPGCVELSEEEVILLLEKMGFTVTVTPEAQGECGYIQDPDSMMQHIYRPSHWVAVKN